MVTLLYGGFGTGKTEHIMNMIKSDCENGVRSLWLVPEQKAVITERRIAKELSPGAQLYTEAVNFTRLCDKVSPALQRECPTGADTEFSQGRSGQRKAEFFCSDKCNTTVR